jgi:hypothetical protein
MLCFAASVPVTFKAGSVLTLTKTKFKHTLDWLASVLIAREEADLTRPASWSIAMPVMHPAGSRWQAWRTLTGSSAQATRDAVTGFLGYDPREKLSVAQAQSLGVGAGVRWSPGAAVRMSDPRGDGAVRP